MKVKELAKCYILRGIDRWFDDYINNVENLNDVDNCSHYPNVERISVLETLSIPYEKMIHIKSVIDNCYNVEKFGGGKFNPELLEDLKQCSDYGDYSFDDIVKLLLDNRFFIDVLANYFELMGYRLEWNPDLLSNNSLTNSPGAYYLVRLDSIESDPRIRNQLRVKRPTQQEIQSIKIDDNTFDELGITDIKIGYTNDYFLDYINRVSIDIGLSSEDMVSKLKLIVNNKFNFKENINIGIAKFLNISGLSSDKLEDYKLHEMTTEDDILPWKFKLTHYKFEDINLYTLIVELNKLNFEPASLYKITNDNIELAMRTYVQISKYFLPGWSEEIKLQFGSSTIIMTKNTGSHKFVYYASINYDNNEKMRSFLLKYHTGPELDRICNDIDKQYRKLI